MSIRTHSGLIKSKLTEQLKNIRQKKNNQNEGLDLEKLHEENKYTEDIKKGK